MGIFLGDDEYFSSRVEGKSKRLSAEDIAFIRVENEREVRRMMDRIGYNTGDTRLVSRYCTDRDSRSRLGEEYCDWMNHEACHLRVEAMVGMLKNVLEETETRRFFGTE